jgi:hypothetical protein
VKHRHTDQYGFNKKHAGTCYDKLVFLHPVGSAGDIVYSGVPGAQNVNALFFLFRCDRFGFSKMRTGRHYTKLVFLHPVGFTVT